MQPFWLDHLVLIVKDLKETETFYTLLLGNPEHIDKESIMYEVGTTKIFFAVPEAAFQYLDKDLGGMNHLAFGVESGQVLRDVEEKLNEASIKHSGIKIDQYGGKEFIWLNDPSEYRIEFYCRDKVLK